MISIDPVSRFLSPAEARYPGGSYSIKLCQEKSSDIIFAGTKVGSAFIQLHGCEVIRGNSGSPILAQGSHSVVVGVVQSTMNRQELFSGLSSISRPPRPEMMTPVAMGTRASVFMSLVSALSETEPAQWSFPNMDSMNEILINPKLASREMFKRLESDFLKNVAALPPYKRQFDVEELRMSIQPARLLSNQSALSFLPECIDANRIKSKFPMPLRTVGPFDLPGNVVRVELTEEWNLRLGMTTSDERAELPQDLTVTYSPLELSVRGKARVFLKHSAKRFPLSLEIPECHSAPTNVESTITK